MLNETATGSQPAAVSVQARCRETNMAKQQRTTSPQSAKETRQEKDRLKYARNRDACIARVVRRQKERYATDPMYAAMKRMRTRLRDAFRSQQVQKRNQAKFFFGCDATSLRLHLESQFLPGMTWENRSEWHIDHIIPVAAFDLKDKRQCLACFHYTNLRPIWAADNRRKRDKVPPGQKLFGFGYAALIEARQAGAARGKG